MQATNPTVYTLPASEIASPIPRARGGNFRNYFLDMGKVAPIPRARGGNPSNDNGRRMSVTRRPSPNPCPRLRFYRASPPCVDLIHLLLGNVHLHRRQLKTTHPRQCFNGPEVSPLGGRESPLPEVTFLERAARS